MGQRCQNALKKYGKGVTCDSMRLSRNLYVNSIYCLYIVNIETLNLYLSILILVYNVFNEYHSFFSRYIGRLALVN